MSTDNAEAKPTDKESDEELIELARKRFALAEEATRELRELALEDWRFRAGDQWPDQVKRDRLNEGRPIPVINKLLAPIRQVQNDQRQNRPSIKVHPVDDDADIETAKIYQGIIRHIEQKSGADEAYDTAFEGAAVGGFGYLRVLTDYVDPTAFDQEAKIEMIENPFSVRLDPFSKKADGSDAKWGFISYDISKDEYAAEYSESELAQEGSWEGLGDRSGGWVGPESCRVAEYYYTDYKDVKVVQLSNGQVVDEDKLAEYFTPEEFPEGIPADLIKNKKTAKVPVINWCKLNGIEILDRTEWPGKWIPIIPVYGDKYIVDGKRHLEGIIRQAKDPQRHYNYWKATETETITLAPKAPWIVAEGQIPKQYEHMWKMANRKSYSVLPYKPTSHDGVLVPPPQRNMVEPPVAAVTQAGMLSSDDIKGTTGIFDATMGNQSNETSGIAIQRRNLQAQTSNFHLVDNLTRSIRHVGRILVDIIPKVYDTARAARIIGEEGQEEIVRINQEFQRAGEKVHYRLGVGEYDVSVDTGPSFATKRQEAAASMIEIAKSAPIVMQAAPDLFIKNLDIPGASEISERIKKILPPGLAEDKNQKAIPPEAQAQLSQMSQMIEQLTTELNHANETINTKRLDIDSRERIEAMKLETQLLIEKMKHEQGLLVETMQQSQKFAQGEVDRQLAELNQIQKTGLSPDQAPIQTQPAGAMSPGAEEQL